MPTKGKSANPTIEADLTIGPPPTPEVEDSTTDAGDIGSDAEFINAPQVDEAVIRTMLKSLGGMAEFAVGRDDVPDHWRFTERELDDLTPPLTRIINRRPAMRAAVARGDEATVAIVLASYTGRNVAAAKKASVAKQKEQRDKLAAEARDTSAGVPTPGNGPDPRSSANGDGRYGGSVSNPYGG